MRGGWRGWLGVSAIGGACFCYAIGTAATTFNVTLHSSGFSAASATLAFDFIDGGSPSNTVSLSALATDGTRGASLATGAVTGAGPWAFADTSFFNEVLVSFGPLGTTTSFSFTTTDNTPVGGSFPDSFSVFVLDASATLPLITTNAPGGSGALFEYDITGTGVGGLITYTPDQAGFSVQVSAPSAPIPEPGSLALLVAGVVALVVRKPSNNGRPPQPGVRP